MSRFTFTPIEIPTAEPEPKATCSKRSREEFECASPTAQEERQLVCPGAPQKRARRQINLDAVRQLVFAEVTMNILSDTIDNMSLSSR